MPRRPLNVFGRPLVTCSMSPLTGFKRTGSCTLNDKDYGNHLVCAVVTEEFLAFTLAQGNDLVTPSEFFQGLKPGDRWCLCALRWLEAYRAGYAPPVVGESTEINALRFIDPKVLQRYLID